MAGKFGVMLLAMALFIALIAGILFLASRLRGRYADQVVGLVLVALTIILIGIGLLEPGLRTIWTSFFDSQGKSFVGLDNYQTIATDDEQIRVLINTVMWVVITPVLATLIGLVYAILVDKAKFEAAAKALIFLPMAISFVGASIIWKFVYEFRPDQSGIEQIGLLNQLIVWLGGSPKQWLIESPWNTVFLIIVLIWVQAGFAMTVLSAAIKAIPDDIIEAARLDGVNAWKMFRNITVPMIRPTLIVVLTTIGIATLKVFDIVRTMTGGNFDTSVVAYEFYRQTFNADNQGLGSALAVVLFILVIPIVAYNIKQLKATEGR